ncbi:response regulator [Gorillibacterium sp. sgz5001074]|uniref:response regulator n=1 Tax=Gorillibacterium sp. sgz5001074 TaxID=3446695 RepID=UPI003F671DAE
MKRILIVDDSSVMRKNLRLILSREGYEVVAEASNGEEARRLYRVNRPDLVTMDITMPVMNGIDAVKAIRQEDPEARIIVISAFDQRNMLFEAMENGAKHYMIKPITAEKLLQAVTQVLKNSGRDPAGPESSDTGARSGPTGEDKTLSQPPSGGFTVENREGIFVMNIPGPAAGIHLPQAGQALQGLLFIRPLSVEFALRGLEDLQEGDWESLRTMIGQIRSAGGLASLSADHTVLGERIRRHFPDVPLKETGRA